MRNNYEVRAQKFVETFFDYAIECVKTRKRNQITQIVDSFNITHHRNVKWCRGYTRIAFITSDYVIKVDYNPDDNFGDSEHELYLYEQAVTDGFDYLFAKITCFKYKNVSFYIMPLITGIDTTRPEDAQRYMTYEEENWCAKHGLFDLHSANYGITRDGLKIFDYAACDMDC